MIVGRTFAVGLLGMLAAACTPMEWRHTAYGVGPSQAEINECDRSAYIEARRQAFFYGYGYGFARPRYFGRPYYAPWPGYSFSDRFFLEQDLFNYCMRVRGYRLVPARPADHSS